MSQTFERENARSHEMTLVPQNMQTCEAARQRLAALLKPRQGVHKTHIMGVLNVTPDSFSGDGLLPPRDRKSLDPLQHILDFAERQIADGADILDIGGESSRPGSTSVSEDEEIARVAPVIRALRLAHPDFPLSIDTCKAAVAHAAVQAGATIVNDISGLTHDPAMAEVIANTGVPVILMHNAAGEIAVDPRLGGRYASSHMPGGDMATLVRDALVRAVDAACARGIDRGKIIVDPGIGFGKTVHQNLQLLNRLELISEIGLPVLVGPSRKSFIGFTLDQPPQERLEGTAATVVLALTKGATIVRVHDVQHMARVCRMTDAVLNADEKVERV